MGNGKGLGIVGRNPAIPGDGQINSFFHIFPIYSLSLDPVNNLHPFKPLGMFFGNISFHLHGELRAAEAVRVARDGIVLAREKQALTYSSISLTALAEAQLAAGHIEDGLASIDEALAHADRVGERIWRPESMRIKGRLLSADGAVQAAEESFRAAVREAADHSLLALELRAINDLAFLLIKQKRQPDAGPLLEGVLNRFMEGFTTSDYQKAQSLLSSCKLPAAR